MSSSNRLLLNMILIVHEYSLYDVHHIARQDKYIDDRDFAEIPRCNIQEKVTTSGSSIILYQC